MESPNYEYIDVSGVIVPDTVATAANVETEFKAAFGADLIVTPDTPQGVLITAEILARDTVIRNNAALANQINPNIAGGVFLDAILALTGSARNPQIYSTVLATLTGVAGTNIAAGVIARNTNGDNWASETAVTLDPSGNALVTFSAVVAGPITAPIGTLTEIVTPVLGWETVNNTVASTVGQATQSDEAARLYRRNTLALQGNGIAEAITSGLNATLGVRSVRFLENTSDITKVIQNVTLVAHSMWACVDGGIDQAVANTLNNKKSAGCGYNGATSVVVVDPNSGQSITVLFDRPTLVPVLARVTISADSSVADPVGTVTANILAYATGLVNGEPGFVVGAQVSPFELAGAITCLTPTIFVKKLEVSYASPINFVTTELFIEIFEKATVDEGSIDVIIV